jgi:putative oxidoreductase
VRVIPDRFAPTTYGLFRIVTGFLFLCNGLQKTMGLFGGQTPPLLSVPGAAGVIETVCGALIMVGFLTRYAAFLASGEMAVAYFMIHQPLGPLPVVNMGERSVFYCFAFLYMASRGPGSLSIDGATGSKT